MSARECGVCKKAPREGEVMRCIRVQEGDAEELKSILELEGDIEPGLYQVIPEVVEPYRKIVAARLGLELDKVSNGMLR